MKYIFTAVNGKLDIKNSDISGQFPKEQYLLSMASVDLIEFINSIDIYNHGIFKKRFQLFEIENIGGTVPTDIQNAYDLISALIPSVNGGGSTTETLLQEIADSNEIIADNTSPNPIVTTLAINDTVDSGSSIPYNQIPFTGIVLGEVYVLTAVGLPTETIHTLSITENDKVNLNVENATATDIAINTTITIIAIKQ